MKPVREVLAALGVLFAIGVVADFYSRLPERIATHFNEAGVANGFGAKSVLWLLVGLSIWSYAMMSIINFLPPTVNSWKPLTVTQERSVWGDVVAMVGWIKLEMVWMMAYLCLAVVRNGLGLQVGLGRTFTPVLLGVVGVTCGFYLMRILRVMRR
jgi:Protein of unknown function (DUF1648)